MNLYKIIGVNTHKVFDEGLTFQEVQRRLDYYDRHQELLGDDDEDEGLEVEEMA
jgi:hypothetical protein